MFLGQLERYSTSPTSRPNEQLKTGVVRGIPSGIFQRKTFGESSVIVLGAVKSVDGPVWMPAGGVGRVWMTTWTTGCPAVNQWG